MADTTNDGVFSQVSKMELTSYDSREGRISKRKVSVNPESYSRKFSTRNKGNSAQTMADGREYIVKVVEFVETLAFELWFDNTGVISNSQDLESDLNWLENNLVRFDGSVHATRYIGVVWGPLNLYGQLKSLDINYLYFNQNGVPLRAKANVSFEQITKHTEIVKEKKSPDLTHQRIIRDGDTLPKLCNEIYHDPSYYIQVAQANELAHFTNLVPGQKIYFPPLI